MWQSICHTDLSDIATLADRCFGEGELTTGAVVAASLTICFCYVVCLLYFGWSYSRAVVSPDDETQPRHVMWQRGGAVEVAALIPGVRDAQM